jgi:hypothetical protein
MLTGSRVGAREIYGDVLGKFMVMCPGNLW